MKKRFNRKNNKINNITLKEFFKLLPVLLIIFSRMNESRSYINEITPQILFQILEQHPIVVL